MSLTAAPAACVTLLPTVVAAPSPAELGEIVQHDSLYGNFMAQTQSDRDSVKAARERMKDQWKPYDKWRAEVRKNAERERREGGGWGREVQPAAVASRPGFSRMRRGGSRWSRRRSRRRRSGGWR